MFDNFDITYSDDLTLDELNQLGLIDGEIERLFYGASIGLFILKEKPAPLLAILA